MKYKKSFALPGFHLTLTYTIFYIAIIVLIPLGMIFVKVWNIGFTHFLGIILHQRVLASIKLTLLCSAAASLINAFTGLLIAWVLTRYDFYGKRFIDMVINIPLALPTSIAGIALATLYSPNSIIGSFFAKINIKIAYTPLGIIIALIFIGIPFSVRTIEPIFHEIDKEIENAASMLGASNFVIFRKIIFPYILPSFLTGFALSFARGLGEYGSIVFISGNIPYFSEVVSLIMITKLEEYDYEGAMAIAALMLTISFCILFIINIFQRKEVKS